MSGKAGIDEKTLIDMARRCARALEEKKAEEIVLMNLMGVNSFLDYFLIATANSIMHARALARETQRYFGERGIRERNRPIMDSPWIVLDYSEIVVHIFTREGRDYYQLERLWADAEHLAF
ncbi:MAG: ribosome silencing factor [Spirochaetes bacterium]|nr:MAG: ribosome silencing factor [Spirochaetota bacterium]